MFRFFNKPSSEGPTTFCLIQQQEDQINIKDNIPPIEEATERKPYGLRIFYNFKQHQSTF
jgi:hypothetical protein